MSQLPFGENRSSDQLLEALKSILKAGRRNCLSARTEVPISKETSQTLSIGISRNCLSARTEVPIKELLEALKAILKAGSQLPFGENRSSDSWLFHAFIEKGKKRSSDRTPVCECFRSENE